MAPVNRRREIGILLTNNQGQRCTLHIQKNVLPYGLCKLLCPVSAALASIFKMDSISTSYNVRSRGAQAAHVLHRENPTPQPTRASFYSRPPFHQGTSLSVPSRISANLLINCCWATTTITRLGHPSNSRASME